MQDTEIWPEIETRLESLGWGFKRYSKGLLISCPNKDWHKNGDSHFSCAVWPEISYYRCFGCGREGRLPRLFEGTGQDLSEFWSLDIVPTTYTPETPVLDESILEGFRPATVEDLNLMNKDYPNRKWGKEHIDKFDLRFDNHFKNIVFPVRCPELVGAVGRNVYKKQVHNYFGFLTGCTLGGYDKMQGNPTLLIVEGWTCLVNCHEWAAEQGYDVLCTFKANVSEEQARMLGDLFKPVVVAFDQDHAGRAGVRKLDKMMDGTIFRRVWNESKGDVGGMNKQTFLEILG